MTSFKSSCSLLSMNMTRAYELARRLLNRMVSVTSVNSSLFHDAITRKVSVSLSAEFKSYCNYAYLLMMETVGISETSFSFSGCQWTRRQTANAESSKSIKLGRRPRKLQMKPIKYLDIPQRILTIDSERHDVSKDTKDYISDRLTSGCH